jgi:hypothetical protein
MEDRLTSLILKICDESHVDTWQKIRKKASIRYVASIVLFDTVSQRLRFDLVLARIIILFIVILSVRHRTFLGLATETPNFITGTD